MEDLYCIETLAVIASYNNYGGQAQLAVGTAQVMTDAVNTCQQGDIKVRSNMIENGVGDVVFWVLLFIGGGTVEQSGVLSMLRKVAKIGESSKVLLNTLDFQTLTSKKRQLWGLYSRITPYTKKPYFTAYCLQYTKLLLTKGLP